jgi:TM2 domain-containing membrane protein YozV
MTDKLPGVNGPRQRIQITEDDLAPSPVPALPARPSMSIAPGHAVPATASKVSAPTPGPAAPVRSSEPPAPPPAPATAALPVATAKAKASPEPPAGAAVTTSGSFCRGCGSAIHPQAVVCPRCGVATVNAAQATGAAMNVALNAKSSGLAILLSLVLTGAGHWYVGRIGRGFAFFAAAIISGMLILAVVGLFLLPIVWAWAAIDANKCAQAHNRLLLAQVGAQGPQAVLTR